MDPVPDYEAFGAPSSSSSSKSFEEVVRSLQAALKNNPRDMQTLLTLGKTYYWYGQIGRAVEVFQRAVELDEKEPAAYYHLGICHFRAARLEQASNALDKAVEIHPHFVMAHYWLGISSYHQGKYEKSLKCFETICYESPESLIARYHAALSCMALGKWERARDHLETLAASGSASTRVSLYLGRAYRRLNRPADAIKVLRRALALNPNDEMLAEALSDLTDVQEP
jgi:tetratricopeptide (TPR) repeat protein